MEFIVVAGPEYSTALLRIRKALKTMDGIELRLDLFKEINIENIKAIIDMCRAKGKKIIITLRSLTGGGGYNRKIDLLEQEVRRLSLLKPDYMDIEWDLSEQLFKDITDTKIIASYHDFEKTPPLLEKVLEKMKQKKAYAYKLCTTSKDLSDSYRMLHFIHKQKKEGLNIIGLCMGETGKITREDGLKVGNYLNYRIMSPRDKVAGGLDFA
ncbi:MAG: 3-dehydroquinate dehydratase [Chlamydiia bacterium]|nr:3-dehydroquinate dehydratase [Chlamydiia bacterium]MCH9618073.1 3-dehydroquinate dehydratase [Chlamydiia bacterium]MCH9624207.1 3-dehydroquinate dehydratase [Chlamydiia bacterium]